MMLFHKYEALDVFNTRIYRCLINLFMVTKKYLITRKPRLDAKITYLSLLWVDRRDANITYLSLLWVDGDC